MSWRQLDTVIHDCTSAPANLDLNSTSVLPALTQGGSHSEVTFVLLNTGTGDAYLATSGDAGDTAKKIPGGADPITSGPYDRDAQAAPLLKGALGAYVYITPMVQGQS